VKLKRARPVRNEIERTQSVAQGGA
jgi:hypothetical protein